MISPNPNGYHPRIVDLARGGALIDASIDVDGLVESLRQAVECLEKGDPAYESGQHRDTGRSEIMGITWKTGLSTLRYAFSSLTWIPAQMTSDLPGFTDHIPGPAGFPQTSEARRRLRRIAEIARSASRPGANARPAMRLRFADRIARSALSLCLGSGLNVETVISAPGLGNRLISRGGPPAIDSGSEPGRTLMLLDRAASSLPFGVRLTAADPKGADVALDRIEAAVRDIGMTPVDVVRGIADIKEILR